MILAVLAGCRPVFHLPVKKNSGEHTGSSFYKRAAAMNWQQRDSLALQTLLHDGLPPFLCRFVPVKVSIVDSASGKKIQAVFYVAPDYLSVGTNHDWARINITPLAAQKVADSVDCFLPTKKMVDDIYRAAVIKPEPVPMYAYRDSTPTMWHHHLIIEGQRKGQAGLIAGIKKDVVISGAVSRDKREKRVAIYGWHKTDGKPIQPLYTGHVYWWVDYSQGVRLIYRNIKVDGRWMEYTDVLKHPVLRRLLCDEEYCDFYRYNYR